MGFSFKNAAQEAGIVRSGLLENRAPAKLQLIMGEVVTLIGAQPAVGKLHGNINRYPAIIFEEYPDHFFKAGAGKISDLISAWADKLGCPPDPDAAEEGYSCVHKNYDALTAELQKQGGVRMVFKTSHNDRTGHDYTDVNLLD